MIRNRVLINIASFGVLAVLLSVWATRNYVTFGLTEPPSYAVEFTFSSSPGLRAGFDVAYLGVPIGTIVDVTLGDQDVLVTADVLAEHDVTADVTASIRRRSAVGEPYIDLAPIEGADLEGGTRLADRPSVPIENTVLPLSYEEVFGTVADLLGAIPADAVTTITHELATALEGREDDLRTAIRNFESVAVTLGERSDLLDQLLVESADLTSFFASESGQVDAIARDVELLAATLRASRDDILTLLDEGPDVSVRIADLLVAARPAAECMLDSTEQLLATMDTPANGRQLRAGLANKDAIIALLADVTHEHESGTFLRVDAFVNQSGEDTRTGTRAQPPGAPTLVGCPAFDGGAEPGAGPASSTASAPAPLAIPTYGDDADDGGDRVLEDDVDGPGFSTDRQFPARAIPAWILLVPLGLAGVIAWRPWARGR